MSAEHERVVLVDGRRTPFCKRGEALAGAPPQELARAAMAGAMEALELDEARVDLVVAGCVSSVADAPNVARQAALEAGIPAATPAYTVNQACASGFRAVTDSVGALLRGEADVALAVGTESMSSYPLLFDEGLKDVVSGAVESRSLLGKVKALAGLRPRHLRPVVSLMKGLVESYSGVNMGQTAEAMAKIHDLPRRELDRVALESHQRLAAAWEEGRMRDEVVPVCPPPEWREVITMDRGFRPRQSMEALAKLKPAFDKADGSVTAGNSCMVTDGAAAVVLMKEEAARAEGREPLAVVKGWAYVGLEPGYQGLMGPAHVIPRLLEQHGMELGDVDLIEINEAFASVILATERALSSETWCRQNLDRGAVGELDRSRLNVNGGALAIGHPLGATGTRLLLTLGKELTRRGLGVGLAALCVHGGLGAAVLLERA